MEHFADASPELVGGAHVEIAFKCDGGFRAGTLGFDMQQFGWQELAVALHAGPLPAGHGSKTTDSARRSLLLGRQQIRDPAKLGDAPK